MEKDTTTNFETIFKDDLYQYLLSRNEVDERLPEAPDLDELWQKIAEAYMPDAIREFPNYPTVALGWIMYVGMAVAKYWFEQYGAVPAVMTHDELEFLLPVPVSEKEAVDVAVELYGFCPDVIDQGPEEATVGALADVLRQSTVWYFWWD